MARNGIKRRIYGEIVANGKSLYAIFDPGAQDSYITKSALKKLNLKGQGIGLSYPVGLGGERRLIEEDVGISGTLDGLPLYIRPYVVDGLGTGEEGKEIELLFGILAMEKWGVELDIGRKKLDLRYFKKEFIEF